MRAVFDTNVLIAAFATEGLCATLLRRAPKGQFQLLLFPIILQEFQRVLRRKLAASPGEAREARGLLLEGWTSTRSAGSGSFGRVISRRSSVSE